MQSSSRFTPTRWMVAVCKPQTMGVRLKYWLHRWLSGPAPKPSQENTLPYDSEFKHLSFTFAVIALSARVACADGPLTREKYITFRESFPLTGGICGRIRSLFTLACQNQLPLEHYILHIKHAFPERKELFSSLIDRLFRIASADGSLMREAERLLSQIAHMLELSSVEYASIHARYKHPSKAHHILGVSKRVKASALKKRYRELIRYYHPDRYAADELSPEMALLLNLKTSEINAAYSALTKQAA